MDFSWSLKPIFVLAKIHGIHFHINKNSNDVKSKIFRFATVLVGLATCLVNFVRVVKIIQYWLTVKMVENFSSKMHLLFFIGACSSEIGPSIFQIKVYFSLFYYVTFTRKWHEILEVFEIIQQEFELSNEFHRNIRKRCYIGMSLLALVSY